MVIYRRYVFSFPLVVIQPHGEEGLLLAESALQIYGRPMSHWKLLHGAIEWRIQTPWLWLEPTWFKEHGAYHSSVLSYTSISLIDDAPPSG